MKAIIVVLLAAVCVSSWAREGNSLERKPPEKGTLTIGLIPARDIFTEMRRFRPLADYLSKRLGTKIELKALSRYGNIIDNFSAEHLDGAFFGSFTYVLAHAKLGVDVLARPESEDGSSTYCGLLITRKDRGLRGVEGLKGKVFAFVDRATTAGYVFPLAVFRKHGIRDYRTFFREIYFTGTHADVLLDVLAGKADAGALKNTVYDEFVRDHPKEAGQLTVLERSPYVPENGLALSRRVTPQMAKPLKSLLLQMNEDAEGQEVLKILGARRFIPTTSRDYEHVEQLAKAAGIDLAAYDYRNH